MLTSIPPIRLGPHCLKLGPDFQKSHLEIQYRCRSGGPLRVNPMSPLPVIGLSTAWNAGRRFDGLAKTALYCDTMRCDSENASAAGHALARTKSKIASDQNGRDLPIAPAIFAATIRLIVGDTARCDATMVFIQLFSDVFTLRLRLEAGNRSALAGAPCFRSPRVRASCQQRPFRAG